MIVLPKSLGRGAAFRQPTKVLNKRGLERFTSNIRLFFGEFLTQDLKSLSGRNIQQALERHELGVEHLLEAYAVPAQEAGLPRR